MTFSGAGDRLTCELSAPLPDAGAPRFLNLRAEMRPRIADGAIDPGLVALRIGQYQAHAGEISVYATKDCLLEVIPKSVPDSPADEIGRAHV